MSGVEALARVLHSLTDGLDGEGTATWPDDTAHREVYALAVEEVAAAILADPGPLLAALAEVGVLRQSERLAEAVEMAASIERAVERSAYNCTCQVGGVDAMSVDTDWLRETVRRLRAALAPQD